MPYKHGSICKELAHDTKVSNILRQYLKKNFCALLPHSENLARIPPGYSCVFLRTNKHMELSQCSVKHHSQEYHFTLMKPMRKKVPVAIQKPSLISEQHGILNVIEKTPKLKMVALKQPIVRGPSALWWKCWGAIEQVPKLSLRLPPTRQIIFEVGPTSTKTPTKSPYGSTNLMTGHKLFFLSLALYALLEL